MTPIRHAILPLALALAAPGRPAAAQGKTYANPVIEANLADPAVVLHEGVYYLYATGDVGGDSGTRVYTSRNLVDWKRGPVVFRPGEPHVWAPDVWRDPASGRFYLYYTVHLTVGVAAAEGPLGPFAKRHKLFDQAIDAHLFRDEDGKLFLYFVKLPGFRIMVQPMASPTQTRGKPKMILRPQAAWERRAGEVTEGPWLLKERGRYYLLYSGSGANTPDYAVGCAVADSPLGPFTRAAHNPIVQRSEGIFGPGHGCAIRDGAGRWWHVYHQKRSERIEWDRFICLDPIWFDARGRLRSRATRGTRQEAPVPARTRLAPQSEAAMGGELGGGRLPAGSAPSAKGETMKGVVIGPALLPWCLEQEPLAQQEEALRIVSRYQATWTEPPTRTPADHAVDGPLMGNGDLGVAIGGSPQTQRFFLCKNDLWRLKSESGRACPVGFGHLAIRIPALQGATYELEQTWAQPETTAVFARDDLTVRMSSMVAATRNLLILQLESEGRTVEAQAVLRVAGGRGSLCRAQRRGNLVWGQRTFEDGVDIPSGAAVAWKVLGTPISPLHASQPSSSRMQTFHVQLGREQYRGGRWMFQGAIDDLRVVGRTLDQEQMRALAAGKATNRALHTWPMDGSPGNPSIGSIPGKIGKAWQFTGDPACFLDCGPTAMPVDAVSVAAWIKIDAVAADANYILTCGEWNRGVSLGLSAGKLRFAVAGHHVESAALPRNRWVHVGGTWDGSRLVVYTDGEIAGQEIRAARAGLRFQLAPGVPVTLVLAMDSLFKSKSYTEDVLKAVSAFSDSSDLTAVRHAHASWWSAYWAKAFVAIDEPVIEKAYYRSLYHLAACSRDPRFPPGIFGWVTTDRPRWAGDYHLNYNHMAPFYALYAANRIEQADPEDAPILAFRKRGRWYARNVTKTRGVLYPVGIGPLGIETTRSASQYNAGPNEEQGGLFFQQRSNSAYCLVNMAQRWRTTYDLEYGRRIYPFAKEVVEFWEDYLRLRGDRYMIIGDAIHEGSGQDINPILTLGLVRNALDLVLDMSAELEVDPGGRAKWRHMLQHLSSWATQERKGKTVFRYSEKGTAWWRNNTLGIQHIYPANALGLDSDPRWLKVARNTISVMDRWLDFNGSNSFFPAAVRVGCDPEIILAQLRRYVHNKYPNGFTRDNPHGIENLSTTPNTIDEMLLMSHVPVGDPDRPESVLRLFPVWPRERNARFVNLRAWGAFLVSSELKGGEVQYVQIVSERGRDCTVVNPWPGRPVRLSDGSHEETLRGNRFSFKSHIDQTIRLVAQ